MSDVRTGQRSAGRADPASPVAGGNAASAAAGTATDDADGAARPLLVELLVEELPPKALRALGEAFARLLADALKAQGLAPADAAVTPYATPRRLAARIDPVRARAADQARQTKLMPVSVGLDAQGAPTQALRKKLAALGLDDAAADRLQRQGSGKAETLVVDSVVPGATLAAGLQQALAEAIAKLPIPKVMQYQPAAGDGTGFQPGWSSVQFVRPVHGLVALHGADVVPVRALGLAAGRTTRGHRFEAAKPVVEFAHADDYAQTLLRDGAVIAGFDARRDELRRQLAAAAAREDLAPIDDDALVDEVTALVERPNVLVCRFEREFLEVPQACLILTMKANQKYFPLLDGDGRLTEKFLVVSNIAPADASRVVEGNERVVRPRLADAKFFFDQDRKRPLASRVDALSRVVYHGKLGSQGDRVERVRAIAAAVVRRLAAADATPMAAAQGAAPAVAQTPDFAADVDRAARLAKADLTTDMVGEFPELQGVMGALYARHDGEREAVAQAVEDHWRPRFAGDALPRGEVGAVVALADRLETLTGLFGIGQLPTGDKDPFALRRHALGLLRLLVERQWMLALDALLADADAAFPPGMLTVDAGVRAAPLAAFVFERFAGLLREQGFRAEAIDAVLASRPPVVAQVPARLQAVRAFALLPEAASLASANKRVVNILKKADGAVPTAVDPALLREDAERALAAALARIEPLADAAHARGDLTASLQALAALKAPVDAFFDAVMVNADDAALRANRLALLARLQQAMNRVADLSRLAV